MSLKWVTKESIAARLGFPSATPDALAIIDAAIIPAQTWVESMLKCPVSDDSMVDVFHLSSTEHGHTPYQGLYVLRSSRKFMKGDITLESFDDWDQYAAANGTPYDLATEEFLDKETGFLRVHPSMDGKILKLSYDSGFADADDVPDSLKEAVTAYLPSILQFSQITNDDTANYRVVIDNARRHALEILSRVVNVSYPNAVRPL